MKTAPKVVLCSVPKAAVRKVPAAGEPKSKSVPRAADDLASLLAEEVRERVRSSRGEPVRDAQEVLLDKEVNGYRLIVVRTQAATGQAVSLSPREIEIARMIGKGLPNKTIAGVLEISSWTVGTHLRRIFAKLGVTSRAAMVTRMMEVGLSERWLNPKKGTSPFPADDRRAHRGPEAGSRGY